MSRIIDAILIYPKVGDEAYAIPHMPLSVLAVGTAAQNKGYNIKIVDQRIDRTWRQTLQESLTNKPLCFGISSMSGPQIKHAVKIAQYIRSISEDIPIVWGGVHASLLPEQTLESKLADIVVIQEGEETFPELLDALKVGKNLAKIPGIGFRNSSDSTVLNDKRNFCDLDKYAFLDYGLIDIKHYQRQGYERIPRANSVGLYTSRGCPFKCSFCYNNSFHNSKWRSQNIDVVIDNFQRLSQKGINRFILCDEYFFQDLERAKSICRQILENNLNLEFYYANCRTDQIAKMTDDDLKLFAKAGFKDIFIGIESGSPRILKLMQKNISLENTLESGQKLTELGISVQYSFMLGLPYEQIEDIRKTLRLMYELVSGLPQCFVPGAGKFIPFPATKAYSQTVDLGWRPPQKLDDWGDITNVNPQEWLGKKAGNIVEKSLFLTSALDMKINPRSDYFLEAMRRVYSTVARWRCKNGYISRVWEYKLVKTPVGSLLRKKRKQAEPRFSPSDFWEKNAYSQKSNEHSPVFLQRQKVLLLMCNWLGDTFWTMQVIPVIKEKYPNAEIWVGIKSRNKDLLNGIIDANKIIVLDNVISDRHREKLSFRQYFTDLTKIRQKKFDLAIDLTGNRYSAIFLFLAKCKKTVGLNTHKFSFLYSIKGPEFNYSQHLSKRPWETIGILFPVQPPSEMVPPKAASSKEQLEKNLELSLNQKTALLMPGAGWVEKQWPLNNFAECGRYFQKNGYQIIVAGSQNEKELCSDLNKQLPDSVIFIKPLKDLIELMPHINLALTNDSGPAHLLAAFGIKTITVFCGNTDPAKCEPIGKDVIILEKTDTNAIEKIKNLL